METFRVLYEGQCGINTEIGYTIYSNLLAFDLPMLFMLAMYAQIYCAAIKHIRKQHFSKYYHAQEGESFIQRSCCCVKFLEAKLNKTDTFRIGTNRSADVQYSSSSEKKTLSSGPPETLVAAAAAAMQMAATMLTTAKEPDWMESNQSHVVDVTQLNHSSSAESVYCGERGADEPPQPITYDALSKLRTKNQALDENVEEEPSRGMVIDVSAYTLASTVPFVDDTPFQASLASSFYSDSVKLGMQTTSSAMQLNNATSFDSIVTQTPKHISESQSSPIKPDTSVTNFVPLSIYNCKQRQKAWLRQHTSLDKKAKDTMKQLTINGPDILKPEEEQRFRARIEQRRERRAIRTLAIITGCFILCWLPFNIHALLSPFLGPIHPLGVSFLLWLGYMNSLLNPVIYTIFSKEFRGAFRKIICVYCFGRQRRQ